MKIREVATAVAFAVMAVLAAGAAHADSADNQFTAALAAANMPGNHTAEIGIAHDMCGLISVPRLTWGIGVPPLTSALKVVRDELLAQGVEPGTEMVAFKNATRDAYCPNLDQVFTG
jgi:hypothetical protein